MKEYLNFIDGAFVPSQSGASFDDVNPADGEVIAQVSEAGEPEIQAAVAAARAAQSGPWSKLSQAERSAMLHRVADGIEDRFEDFLEAECLDTGKPASLARQIDIPRGAANFRIFADLVKNVPGESFVLDTPDGAGALNYALRKPKGVIAVICPWNLPLLLMTWKVGPALACGNSVVVKPSEETPATATLLGEVMNEAGIPRGVYNVVHGFGPDSAGEFLTTHPDIDGITFTGETRTGAAIQKACADNIVDVSFELGGKNPSLVFADCDLDKAVEGTLRSVFANCGQVCLCTERVYVEKPVFDEFVARLKQGAESLVQGAWDDESSSMGPLISEAHRQKVLAYYDRAIEEGAKLITGGGVPDMPKALAGGAWVQPTVWTGLKDDASCVRDEIFGPCCHVRPFETEDEAIRLANDTEYGLAAAVWTENATRAHRVAAQIDAGVVWVNTWFLRDLRTAFGGVGQSGIGREGGVHSMDFYTESTNVCLKL